MVAKAGKKAVARKAASKAKPKKAKRKAGRPAFPPSERRSEVFGLRFKPGEAKIIRERLAREVKGTERNPLDVLCGVVVKWAGNGKAAPAAKKAEKPKAEKPAPALPF